MPLDIQISRPVSLIFIWGLMGSGKSTTGKKLASKLGWDFIDSDKEIELQQQRTIAQIFDEEGEQSFRSLESVWINEINVDRAVIAVGGGAPCFNGLDQKMKELGLCIWFDAPIGMLSNRILNSNTNRPLLEGLTESQMKERLIKLMDEREKIYNQAHLIVQVNKLSVDELVSYVNLAISEK